MIACHHCRKIRNKHRLLFSVTLLILPSVGHVKFCFIWLGKMMLKPFKTVHHFKVMLETRMVGLIAHLHTWITSLNGWYYTFFAGNWVRILPVNSKQTHNSNQRNSDPVSPGQFTISRWIKTKLRKFELRISDFWPLRLNAAWLDFWPPTSHFLLPTSHFRFPTSDFPLPFSHF